MTSLPRVTVRVTPDSPVFTGETVTLKCEIEDQYRSLNWRYQWYKDTTKVINSERYTVNRDSLTITGVTQSDQWFWCSAVIHGRPQTLLSSSLVYLTVKGSKPKPEFTSDTEGSLLTGVSPSVSLIIRPNRSQHFSSESLSLSCEDHSKSTGWTVRRYTDKLKPCSSSDTRSTGTTSTCTIRSLYTSDTGVYWCQSQSGEKLHPVNISVHNVDVILDSPVHSVTKGDNLTLRCLYRDKKPSNLRAEFYKDGSVVQNQTTGDMMIIPTVSKSHEGFYYCKHPERGESPKSWISVRGDTFICSWTMSYRGLIAGIVVGVSVMFLSIYLLLWSNKKKKGSSFALKDNTSEGDDIMYSKLKKGEDQDVAFGSSDVTNAQKK
ncbi:uncharacterized protein [Paramisgurnus dabryanus]|uniref:uncharacterized protein n=1 Tax=Paramisgurnus dabryanus TaxID=90735 RepID=UPI003CCF126C